jgi:hypothetical protein
VRGAVLWHIAEHRADTALVLKMTQQARTVFEELRASTHKPQESTFDVEGMTVHLKVRPLSAPLGDLSASFSTTTVRQFVLLTVTISGKTSMGVARTLAFTSGMRVAQEQ